MKTCEISVYRRILSRVGRSVSRYHEVIVLQASVWLRASVYYGY